MSALARLADAHGMLTDPDSRTVTHPQWCDRDGCTAFDDEPTRTEIHHFGVVAEDDGLYVFVTSTDAYTPAGVQHGPAEVVVAVPADGVLAPRQAARLAEALHRAAVLAADVAEVAR